MKKKITVPSQHMDDEIQTPPQRDSISLEDQIKACITIQRWFRSHYQRETFRLLKESIRLNESTCTKDVAKLLNSRDAPLLLDPAIEARVRFRFGGTSFPPFIYYKIFLDNTTTVLIDGKTSSEKSQDFITDAGKLMGIGKLTITLWESSCADSRSVSASRDSNPAYLGGRNNFWRILGSEDPLLLMGATPSSNVSTPVPPAVLGDVDEIGAMHVKTSYSRALSMFLSHIFILFSYFIL